MFSFNCVQGLAESYLQTDLKIESTGSKITMTLAFS